MPAPQSPSGTASRSFSVSRDSAIDSEPSDWETRTVSVDPTRVRTELWGGQPRGDHTFGPTYISFRDAYSSPGSLSISPSSGSGARMRVS